MMTKFRVGVQLAPQHTSYESYAKAIQKVEALGVDTVFNWDHFFPLSGDPDGMHLEPMTLLTAIAYLTSRVEIGTLVTCNSYRNPNLLADITRTIDHISSGRLILGIGAGWFEKDYDNYSYEFGTAATRLKALDRDLPVILDRWKVLNPPPTRKIPVLVGGAGEKVTLRIVAQHADIWNGFGPPEEYRHKNQVLDRWCAKVGRDPAAIERSATFFSSQIDQLDGLAEAGATHMIMGMSAPWDYGAIEKLVNWRDHNN